MYKGHGWSLAEDHINYTVGRQCLNRQQIEAACKALAALLKPESMQTAAQQTAYLNEFIHVHQVTYFINSFRKLFNINMINVAIEQTSRK